MVTSSISNRSIPLAQAVPFTEETKDGETAAMQTQSALRRLHCLTQNTWTHPSLEAFPPFPQALEEFLSQECTIWSGKKRSETHIVVPLFPNIDFGDGNGPVSLTLATLNRLDNNLNNLEEWRGFEHIWEEIPQNTALGREFHWAVMTKDLLPKSKNQRYDQQTNLLPEGYTAPSALEAALAILYQYRSTGERLFTEDLGPAYTRCKERVNDHQLVVGHFSSRGLRVDFGYTGRAMDSCVGLAGWRTF